MQPSHHPLSNSPSTLKLFRYPPDYFAVPCTEFCAILEGVFGTSVSDGTLRSLFAAFGGDEPQGMTLPDFLSSLVFLCGPEPGVNYLCPVPLSHAVVSTLWSSCRALSQG
jgi:hypothetical protein